ncbi:transposase [Desulfoprunum benzoelyticum]
MGRVQRSPFAHLNNCLPTPLTEQEQRLVSILEIVEVERHVPRIVTRYRYPGRKPRDRQALARAFVAKALYRYPTTSDLHRALQSTANLRRICGFGTAGSLPSEATFSRAFCHICRRQSGQRGACIGGRIPVAGACRSHKSVFYGDCWPREAGKEGRQRAQASSQTRPARQGQTTGDGDFETTGSPGAPDC